MKNRKNLMIGMAARAGRAMVGGLEARLDLTIYKALLAAAVACWYQREAEEKINRRHSSRWVRARGPSESRLLAQRSRGGCWMDRTSSICSSLRFLAFDK
jgi:hypothetical protein